MRRSHQQAIARANNATEPPRMLNVSTVYAYPRGIAIIARYEAPISQRMPGRDSHSFGSGSATSVNAARSSLYTSRSDSVTGWSELAEAGLNSARLYRTDRKKIRS